MAFTFGFYDSMNGDRKYTAEQMSAIFDGVITDGVFDNIGELFATVPGDGMQVLVKSGKAWFYHTWNINDSTMVLNLQRADLTRPRYDTVVLEIDASVENRKNAIKIITGDPLVTPVKPDLVDTGTFHQIPLAHILVEPEVTEIAASKIEIVVGRDPCPFVTGLIDSVDITDLFNQWQGDFQEWFDNLKAQLTDNVVTNLQNQIDNKLNISDKATSEEAIAGTDNTKYLTPASLSATLNSKVTEVGDIKWSGEELSVTDPTHYRSLDGSQLTFSSYPILRDRVRYRYGVALQQLGGSRNSSIPNDQIYNHCVFGDYILIAAGSNTSNKLYVISYNTPGTIQNTITGISGRVAQMYVHRNAVYIVACNENNMHFYRLTSITGTPSELGSVSGKAFQVFAPFTDSSYSYVAFKSSTTTTLTSGTVTFYIVRVSASTITTLSIYSGNASTVGATPGLFFNHKLYLGCGVNLEFPLFSSSGTAITNNSIKSFLNFSVNISSYKIHAALNSLVAVRISTSSKNALFLYLENEAPKSVSKTITVWSYDGVHTGIATTPISEYLSVIENPTFPNSPIIIGSTGSSSIRWYVMGGTWQENSSTVNFVNDSALQISSGTYQKPGDYLSEFATIQSKYVSVNYHQTGPDIFIIIPNTAVCVLPKISTTVEMPISAFIKIKE